MANSQEPIEPVAWREHVEQRLRSWRQSQMNRYGDRLALDDFMGEADIEDLIDWVCDEYAGPSAPPAESERIAALEAALADAYAEGRKDEREEWTAEFKPSGWGCTCAGPDGPCESCEANRAAYEEWLAERPWHARIAALEAALKVAGEALEHLNNVYSGDSELIITALRAIEEVRK